MKARGKLTKRRSRKEFKRGGKVHIMNIKQAPARGGIKL